MRRWLARLGLLLGGLLIGVLLIELGFRLRKPLGDEALLFNAPAFSPLDLYTSDPELVVVPAPGWSGTVATMEYRTSVRINAQGLRGPELEPKPEGGYRILAVGDSFTISNQVEEDDTFEQLLAGSLTERLERPVEVLNGGVDGYGTAQSWGRVERLKETAALDGVLLVYFLGNDLFDNCFFGEGGFNAPPEEPPPPPLMPLHERVLGRVSHAWAWLQVQRAAQFVANDPNDPRMGRYREELSIFMANDPALDRTLPCTERAMQKVKRRCDQTGLDCYVALAPPAYMVHAERAEATFEMVGLDPAGASFDRVSGKVAGALSIIGLPTQDLTPDLQAAAEDDTLYLTYDGHWTEDGHAVVAETLSEFLYPLIYAK